MAAKGGYTLRSISLRGQLGRWHAESLGYHCSIAAVTPIATAFATAAIAISTSTFPTTAYPTTLSAPTLASLPARTAAAFPTSVCSWRGRPLSAAKLATTTESAAASAATAYPTTARAAAAFHGHYCRQHHQRMQQWLRRADHLLARLRHRMRQHARRRPDASGDDGRDVHHAVRNHL